MKDASPRLIELWLTLVHGALCRQAAGGLLAQVPAGSKLPADWPGQQLGLVFPDTDSEQLEREVRQLFGESGAVVAVTNDIKSSPQEGSVSLRRALSELQSYLADTSEPLPADVELVAFLLRHGEYRSRHIPLRRVSYHVVPHQGTWKLKRQGEADGESFGRKEDAVRAGTERARAHAAGQLIIHAADGTFEEERTYGADPAGRG